MSTEIYRNDRIGLNVTDSVINTKKRHYFVQEIGSVEVIFDLAGLYATCFTFILSIIIFLWCWNTEDLSSFIRILILIISGYFILALPVGFILLRFKVAVTISGRKAIIIDGMPKSEAIKI